VRPERGRTKKLIVAFHFQFANQAGWKCEECRKNGLEAKRRCGWLAESGLRGRPGAGKMVWGRRRVFLDTCPRSFVSAESIGLVEAFAAWKLIGSGDFASLPARTADAFCVLENELRAEMSNATE
jgi:hypothetical protein